MTRRESAIRSQPTPLQRVREGGLSELVLAIPALYVVGALILAWLVLSVDQRLGEQAIPDVLRFGEENARSLLTALSTAYLTVVALVFWVRMLAVQHSSDEFPSRVLRRFLTDAAQQHVMGFILAGLTYGLAVVRAIPDQGAGLATVPHLAVSLATLMAVLSAGAIVFAVYQGTMSSQIGHLVRWLADTAVDRIRDAHPPLGEGASDEADVPVSPEEEPTHVVHATDSGWVQRIDEDRLLRAVPPRTVIEFHIRVGVFVVEGTQLCAAWGEGDPETITDAAHRAVRLGVDPTMEQDPALPIRQMVDIAERTLTPMSGDTTTAREVVLHLGLVLRELLLRDLPALHRIGDDGRELLRPREHTLDDYVDLAFARVRIAEGGTPDTAEALLGTIGMLVRELEAAGLPERTDSLRRQARLVMAGAERKELLEADKETIRARARREGLETVVTHG